MAQNQIHLKDFTVYLNKRLGSGGQAPVYEAHKEGKKYAAKCILNKTVEALLEDELLVHKTQKTHRNVIQIEDFCEQKETNSAWIFMEFCKYGSLNDYCKNHVEQFNSKKVKLDLMLQIAEGLKFIHECKLVHRDIKPSYILLTKNEGQLTAKISDFGVSRDDMGTCTQTVVGTLPFLAPECWPIDGRMHKRYNEKVDIFALGLTFLTLIQESHDPDGLFPKVKGLKRSQQHIPIGELMYMRQLDGEPPLDIVREQPDDDEFTRVTKALIAEATQVDPEKRVTADYIHQKLMLLAMKQVIVLGNDLLTYEV